MLGKIEILIVIFALLLTFYIVIWLGSGAGKKSPSSKEIAKYLFGVRVLIIILAIVSLILWFFM
jgi:hypothetical protein